MSRVRRSARAGLAGAVLLLAVNAPPGFAQAPSLSGETLESNPGVVPADQTTFGSSTCDKDGTTTITFETTGTALGPYSGTFTETGTVTIGPQTDTTIDVRGAGAVLAFDATFTIESVVPPATITGTKTLAPGTPTTPGVAGFARCDPDGGPASNDVFVNVLNAFVLYEAQIDTTLGSRTDSGNSSFTLRSMPAPPATSTFVEVFNSSEPPPPVGCDEDDQGEDGDDQGEDCDDDDQGEDEN